MLGLTPLVALAVYGVIAALSLGALYAFDQSRQNIGERRVEARYQALSGLCDTFPAKTVFGTERKITPDECAKELRDKLATGDKALAVNDGLKVDVAKLRTERDECSEKVLLIQRQGARAAAIAAARKPADDAKIAAIAPERAELVALLGLPEPPGTCEAKLARRDALWAKVAAQRQRDFPPTGAVPDKGDVTIKAPK